jgi:hypothetical protein
LIQRRTAEGINLLLEFLNGLLILPQILFKLVPCVCVTQSADQDTGKERTKQSQKEGDAVFKPWVRKNGGKAESKGDVVSILHGKKDDTEKNDHPQNRFDPFHLGFLLS